MQLVSYAENICSLTDFVSAAGWLADCSLQEEHKQQQQSWSSVSDFESASMHCICCVCWLHQSVPEDAGGRSTTVTGLVNGKQWHLVVWLSYCQLHLLQIFYSLILNIQIFKFFLHSSREFYMWSAAAMQVIWVFMGHIHLTGPFCTRTPLKRSIEINGTLLLGATKAGKVTY